MTAQPRDPGDYEQTTGHEATCTAGFNDHCTCETSAEITAFTDAVETAAEEEISGPDPWESTPKATTTLACPSECDPDCDTGCHEHHAIPAKRHHNPATCPGELRDRIAALFRIPPGVERLGNATPGEIADAVLAAIQDAYVPPPPGSDRDALPPDLRALIQPHMPAYESTACQTGRACRAAAKVHPERAAELLAWVQREHVSCRLTRKQDMATCRCDCHKQSTR